MITLADYHRRTRRGPDTALATVPLVLCYGLGLLIASPHARSGLDVVSASLRATLGDDGFVWVPIACAALLLGWAVWMLGSRVKQSLVLAPAVVVESIAWGAGLGYAVIFIIDQATTLGPILLPAELIDRTVLSAGAGLHEELVFRLIMLTGLYLTLKRLCGLSRLASLVLAVVASSVCFAAAHHIAGENFVAYAFTYRCIAGALFALLFLWRGFAVAAWSHASYDFMVLSGL